MTRVQKVAVAAALTCVGLSLVGCRRTPQEKEARYIKAGQEFMQKTDYSRAVLNFLNAARAVPADAEPYYQLGLAYLGSNNIPRAAGSFRKATELNPKHWQANLKLAELMAATRNAALLEEAANRIHGVLEALPENTEAMNALAVTELRQGNTAEAVDRLEKTLEKFPAHLQSAMLLARVKLGQRDFPGAEAALQKAVAAAPGSAPPLEALGRLYILTRQFDNAEQQARKALAIQAQSPDGLAILAASQSGRRQWDAAEQTYRLIAALPDARFRSAHAVYLYRRGNRDAALAELRQLNRKTPDDRDLRTRLVALCLEMNQTDEASALLAAALKQNPKDTQALFQRSEVELRAGKAAEAEKDLRLILRSQPDMAVAHYLLAAVQESQGLQDSARQELSEALKFDRGLLPARLALAGGLLRANQPKAAVDILDQAPDTQKTIQAVVLERNRALLQAGDVKAVRASLDRLLPSNPVPELQLQDAALRMIEHDYAGARSRAEEVLRTNPEDVRAARVVAQSFAAENRREKGLQRLRELSDGHPQSAPLRELLGVWYMESGNNAEARTAFESAKTNEIRSTTAEIALAELDRREKRLDAAMGRLGGIVAADPRNGVAAVMLAEVKREAGDAQGSISAYRSVLSQDGSNVTALNNLAYLIAQQNPAEALELAQRAERLAPGDPFIQDTLGWIYYCRGSYQAAAGYLKTSFEKSPTARHQFHLAMAYIRSGDRANGGKLLDGALKKDPSLSKTEVGW